MNNIISQQISQMNIRLSILLTQSGALDEQCGTEQTVGLDEQCGTADSGVG